MVIKEPKNFTTQQGLAAIIALTIIAVAALAVAITFVVLWNARKPAASSSTTSSSLAPEIPTAFLYLPVVGNFINSYSVNQSDGSLIPLGSNPIVTGTGKKVTIRLTF
jgi:hypothetical protein